MICSPRHRLLQATGTYESYFTTLCIGPISALKISGKPKDSCCKSCHGMLETGDHIFVACPRAGTALGSSWQKVIDVSRGTLARIWIFLLQPDWAWSYCRNAWNVLISYAWDDSRDSPLCKNRDADQWRCQYKQEKIKIFSDQCWL